MSDTIYKSDFDSIRLIEAFNINSDNGNQEGPACNKYYKYTCISGVKAWLANNKKAVKVHRRAVK
jgi:hypothetical protein